MGGGWEGLGGGVSALDVAVKGRPNRMTQECPR